MASSPSLIYFISKSQRQVPGVFPFLFRARNIRMVVCIWVPRLIEALPRDFFPLSVIPVGPFPLFFPVFDHSMWHRMALLFLPSTLQVAKPTVPLACAVSRPSALPDYPDGAVSQCPSTPVVSVVWGFPFSVGLWAPSFSWTPPHEGAWFFFSRSRSGLMADTTLGGGLHKPPSDHRGVPRGNPLRHLRFCRPPPTIRQWQINKGCCPFVQQVVLAGNLCMSQSSGRWFC